MDKMFNNIAVLVDADNATASQIQSIISTISTFGRITLKRVYGNWKKEALKNWEAVVIEFGFNPQQQFDYVKKKNATDIALVIDAMRLLYTERYDAFAIVSSDSDYTPLCIALKETGVFVLGFGADKASDAFKRSCDEFFSASSSVASNENDENGKTPKREPDAPEMSKEEKELHGYLKKGAETEHWQDEDGFVNVASVGQFIKRNRPDFNIKNFGFRSLPEFIAAHPTLYETKKYRKGKTNIQAYKCK